MAFPPAEQNFGDFFDPFSVVSFSCSSCYIIAVTATSCFLIHWETSVLHCSTRIPAQRNLQKFFV